MKASFISKRLQDTHLHDSMESMESIEIIESIVSSESNKQGLNKAYSLTKCSPEQRTFFSATYLYTGTPGGNVHICMYLHHVE